MRNKNLFDSAIYRGWNANEDFKVTAEKAARLGESGVCECGICRRLYLIDIFDSASNMLECEDCFKATVRQAVNLNSNTPQAKA